MKTNHMQRVDRDGDPIYCHFKQNILPFTEEHVENYCMKCPYFAGNIQGRGIECTFESYLNVPFMMINSPVELMSQLDKKGYMVKE